MKPLYQVVITFANGSTDTADFSRYSAVRDYYQHGISYSGGRVKRVEVHMHDGGVRAIWDSSWDAIGQMEGLRQ